MATADVVLPSPAVSDAKTSEAERVDGMGQGSRRQTYNDPDQPYDIKSESERRWSTQKITRIREEEAGVEVTVDVRDDLVPIRNTKAMERRSLSSLRKTVSIKVLNMTQELRQKVSTYGRPQRLDRSNSGAARALKGLQFVTKKVGTGGWPEVERRFDELAEDGVVLRSRFGQCIGMGELDSKEFAMQVYDALARRNGITAAVLTKEELRAFWEQLSDQSFDARLKTFFDMVDKNADGRITQEEVKEIITLSACANKLSQITKHADEYAALIMEEFDGNHLGYIELNNLEKLLLSEPTQATNLTTSKSGLSRLLSKQLIQTKGYNPVHNFCLALFYFLEDNWERIWVITLWLCICAGLFAWKFVQYRHRAVFNIMGYCVATAKGSAETLKFNMALILLPVCRNTITWLRSKTKLGAVVPFNDSINFHMIIAAGIAVGVGLHAVPHLTCDFPRLVHASNTKYEPMKPFFGEQRPPNYWWFIKGTDGWTGLVMVVLMAVAFVIAQPWFRRNKLSPKNPLRLFTGFNVFWYSHHLFIIVYALLLVHGTYLYLTKKWYEKTTWMYLAIPVMLYAFERLLRGLRPRSETVRIQKAAVYREKALALYMSKPHGFKYRSGQYIFVKCDRVSPFEWHPFSISSAPGDDYLSIHISTTGDWTSELKAIFSKVCQPAAADQSGVLVADCVKGENNPGFPRLLIDGPYGAPAQDYWHYDVLLLIGLGIGATPLISIVKDVLDNIEQNSDVKKGDEVDKKTYMTQRVYFYWMTREQGSFKWFEEVMNEVAEKDNEGVIELHNHCTSVYEEGDARSALILMLQELNHAKNGVDIVSGTSIKTHFAKPNWRNVFKHVAANHVDQRVGVFYCGRPELIRELRRLAREFSHNSKTKFDFHKENF